MRIDRRMLSRAKPRALARLARYVGVPVSATFDRPSVRLVEAVVRVLDTLPANEEDERIVGALGARRMATLGTRPMRAREETNQ